jgi:hypothetical protein
MLVAREWRIRRSAAEHAFRWLNHLERRYPEHGNESKALVT